MEKPKENIRREPTIGELKIRVFDLIEIRKKVDAEMNALYQMIAAKAQDLSRIKKSKDLK